MGEMKSSKDTKSWFWHFDIGQSRQLQTTVGRSRISERGVPEWLYPWLLLPPPPITNTPGWQTMLQEQPQKTSFKSLKQLKIFPPTISSPLLNCTSFPSPPRPPTHHCWCPQLTRGQGWGFRAALHMESGSARNSSGSGQAPFPLCLLPGCCGEPRGIGYWAQGSLLLPLSLDEPNST